jgi:acetylornithine deacetylase/succinyl-diaminopimelate desuccinylase-like protein
VVADACEATIDRRLIPGEDASLVTEEIRDILREVERDRERIRAELRQAYVSPWFEAPGEDAYTRRFMEVVRGVSGRGPGPAGYIPGSDAKFFMPRLAQTPTVVFGPGSYEQAHAVDEWVAIDELLESVRILEEFAREVCEVAS